MADFATARWSRARMCKDNINQLIMAFSYITLTFQKTKD